MALEGGVFSESAAFPLAGDELENWLRTDGVFLFTEIESGTALLDFLRLNGVSIGTQKFFDIRADVLYSLGRVESLRRDLSTLAADNPDALIPLGWLTQPTWESQSWEFLYRVGLHGFDATTGESTLEWMMIGSDVQLTWNEVRDLAASYISGGMTSGGNVLEDMTLDAEFGFG